jgi:hypothetical protein
MVAAGAFAELGAGGRRVKMAAGDAMESGLAALALEVRMIPAVIVKPQAEEHRRDKQAVDHNRGGQGDHGSRLTERPDGAKRRILTEAKEPAIETGSFASVKIL